MNIHEKCYCNDKHAIVIDRKSASRVTSCLALGIFLVFAIGYFIGKRHAFYDEPENQEIVLSNNNIQLSEVLPGDIQQINEPEVHPLITADMQNYAQDKNDVHYIALLSGYGTQRAAQRFVQNLGKKGIKAEVKKRVSSNAKEQRIWYQVVTQKYDNRTELKNLVDQLKIEEHITNDIEIVEVA